MLNGIDVPKLITDALLGNFPVVFNIFKPIIIGFLVVCLIKILCSRYIHFRSILLGYNKRETKKQIKNANNFIDLISSAWDIFRK